MGVGDQVYQATKRRKRSVSIEEEFDEIVASDDAVRSNTELELTIETATALIRLLQAAIHKAKDAS
jgi:hypothetical protein